MSDNQERSIFFYKSYFMDFFKGLKDQNVKDKVLYVLRIIETIQRVSTDYLKHIEGTDGLYEKRVKQGSDIYRIFCFFDAGNLVVVANGFQKKT